MNLTDFFLICFGILAAGAGILMASYGIIFLLELRAEIKDATKHFTFQRKE